MVMALDLRLDGREFDSRPPRILFRRVTVFGRVKHLGISLSHVGQLSLLPSAGREMSTGQNVSAGEGKVWLIPYVDKRVGGR